MYQKLCKTVYKNTFDSLVIWETSIKIIAKAEDKSL
jgi:hypothetical protein